MKSYLVQLITIAVVIFVTVVGFNYAVDPFGFFAVDTLAERKTQAQERGRIVKAYRSAAYDAEVLLLGNSRVELGLDPAHPAFAGKRVYNLGLPGTDMRLQASYANNAVRHGGEVRQLIVGVDFIDFIYLPGKRLRQQPASYEPRLRYWLDGSENGAYWKTAAEEHFTALASLDALKASVATLFTQSARLGAMQSNGFFTDDEFHAIVHYEGLGVLFEQKETTLRDKFTGRNWQLTEPGENSSHYLQLFASFVQSMQAEGIDVRVFISPYHRNYLDILAETGQLDSFARWKQLLVEHLDAAGFFDSGQLWDFSGDNAFTTEAVPPRDVRDQYMEGYWEPAHYRHQLGAKIIDTLLLGKAPWGVELQPVRE